MLNGVKLLLTISIFCVQSGESQKINPSARIIHSKGKLKKAIKKENSELYNLDKKRIMALMLINAFLLCLSNFFTLGIKIYNYVGNKSDEREMFKKDNIKSAEWYLTMFVIHPIAQITYIILIIIMCLDRKPITYMKYIIYITIILLPVFESLIYTILCKNDELVIHDEIQEGVQKFLFNSRIAIPALIFINTFIFLTVMLVQQIKQKTNKELKLQQFDKNLSNQKLSM